jgi:hypothetical protein
MTDFDVLAATPSIPEWTLQQSLHFQRVYKAAAEGQHLIMPAGSAPIAPGAWLDIAHKIAMIAAEKFAVLPDLRLIG